MEQDKDNVQKSEAKEVLAELGRGLKKFLLGIFFIFAAVAVIVIAVTIFSGSNTSIQVAQHKPMEVVVSSQTIKAVDEKYRYFFDIRNRDTDSFAGAVKIDLINAGGDSVYNETFSSKNPIASGIGNSVYFDINTGPTSVHGSSGIKSFNYTVSVGGSVVKTGSGEISSRLE